MQTVSVILPAAGKSRRFIESRKTKSAELDIRFDDKKLFAQIDDRPVWYISAQRFLCRPDVRQVIVVISTEDREQFTARYADLLAANEIELVDGGKERSDSVAAGLERVDPTVDLVCVHDAARPLVTQDRIDAVFAAAGRSGAAMLAVPIVGTIKRSVKGESLIDCTVDRSDLWEAQTPQVFDRNLLIDAYARREALQTTDDAQLFERIGRPVVLVEGSRRNLKITTEEDLETAARLLPLTVESE